jgi:hypothetical protein
MGVWIMNRRVFIKGILKAVSGLSLLGILPKKKIHSGGIVKHSDEISLCQNSFHKDQVDAAIYLYTDDPLQMVAGKRIISGQFLCTDGKGKAYPVPEHPMDIFREMMKNEYIELDEKYFQEWKAYLDEEVEEKV